jgi:hypothetical protein
MRSGIPLLVAVLLLATPNANAQQPDSSDKPPVTILTGCLRSSGADTAVAGPSGRIYTLEVVDPPPKPSSTTTTGSAPPVASKTTYSLDADESLGLAKHADHEVQLTGKLQTPSTAAAAPGTAAAAKERKPSPGGGHRTFHVSALKMISTKCP